MVEPGRIDAASATWAEPMIESMVSGVAVGAAAEDDDDDEPDEFEPLDSLGDCELDEELDCSGLDEELDCCEVLEAVDDGVELPQADSTMAPPTIRASAATMRPRRRE
jgi:hypothetical protein